MVTLVVRECFKNLFYFLCDFRDIRHFGMLKCGHKMILGILLSAIIVSGQAANCTFPASIEGTWLSSSHGTWTANSTHIYGMDFKIQTYNTGPKGLNYTFSCLEHRYSNIYAIASVTMFEIFVGLKVTLHTCIDLSEISSAKFVYYVAKAPDKNQDIFTVNDTFEGICDSGNYNASYSHHVIVRNGSERDAFILCPPSIYGTFSYNESCKDPMYNTTNVNVCRTRQEIVFNYNVCITPVMYSQEGILDCVYYITNGSVSYLTVFNSDSITPDEVAYYRFSCVVLEEMNNIVYLTANPKECTASQNTTFASTGQKMVWRPYELCPIKLGEKQDDLIWIAIAVGIVVGLVIMIIISFVIIRCISRIKLTKKEEEQPITKETLSDEMSIDKDYGNDERKSVDSGISEQTDTQRRKEETKTTCEIYIDDKSYPATIKIESECKHDNEQKCATNERQTSEGPSQRRMSDSDDENVSGEKSELEMNKKDGEIYQDMELTTSLKKTLISREGEDRKRQLKSKEKKRKVRKIRTIKLKHNIDREVRDGEGDQKNEESERGFFDPVKEDLRIDGAVIAPFTTQYKYKKHVEHILGKEYYLTGGDSKDKTNNLDDLDTLSTSTAIDHLYREQDAIESDARGTISGSGTDSDSFTSHSEDVTKTFSDADDTVKISEKKNSIHWTEKKKGHMDNPRKSGLNVIHVKELNQAQERSGESFSIKTESSVEDEVYIDVQLRKDQQELIYNSLHDEYNNLRPCFERNEEGKIIRKSDQNVVYDPRSGTVRIRKQIGNIFSVRRHKRTKRGRLIGDYHDDQFGPSSQKQGNAEFAGLYSSIDIHSMGGKRPQTSKRNSTSRSAGDLKKEDTTRTKSIAFGVRNEVEVMPMDNFETSEMRTKDQRDISSAIRKKLRDRLFRRHKQRVETPRALFLRWKQKKAWVQSDSTTVQEKIKSAEGSHIYERNVQQKPLNKLQGNEILHWSSKGRHNTITYNRSLAGGSFSQRYKRMFKQGLETDKKVIYRLTEQTMDTLSSGFDTNNDASYTTAVKMDEDLNTVCDNGPLVDKRSDNSFFKEGNNGTESPISSTNGRISAHLYNDYRLRLLLEELFRDKKYLDHYIQTADPKSEVLMETKGIAVNGRDFLLERAKFWETREPIPPIPSLIVSRALTSFQEDIRSTSTVTPIQRSNTLPVNLPGYISHLTKMSNENIKETTNGTVEHESYI